MRSCFNETSWQSTLLFVCIPPHTKSNLWQVKRTKIQYKVNNFPQHLFFGQYFYKKEGKWEVRFISRCSVRGNVVQNQSIKRSQNARITWPWVCLKLKFSPYEPSLTLWFSYDTWLLQCQNFSHPFLLTSCWNWFHFSFALILINSCSRSTMNFLLELCQIFPDMFFVLYISRILSLL